MKPDVHSFKVDSPDLEDLFDKEPEYFCDHCGAKLDTEKVQNSRGFYCCDNCNHPGRKVGIWHTA